MPVATFENTTAGLTRRLNRLQTRWAQLDEDMRTRLSTLRYELCVMGEHGPYVQSEIKQLEDDVRDFAGPGRPFDRL